MSAQEESRPTSMGTIELREVTKRFGNVLANERVTLRVPRGSIHGIVGENGAGKSTAMKVLFGLYRPDAGSIWLDGRRCIWRSPADAIAAGIGMVHQHFLLAGPCSGLDNVILGAEPRRRGLIDRTEARRRLEELSAQYGLAVDWERPVEALPVGMQQRVEILKLLFRDASILIFDEPTAVLTPQETSDLFSNLRRLRDQGKTILLVTHKLKEVMALTGTVTILRAGRVMGERQTARTNPQELADLMVGRKAVLQVQVSAGHPKAEPAIEVSHLTLAAHHFTRSSWAARRHGGMPKICPAERPRLRDVTFSVRRGELVGLAGVEGNGQSDLIRALLNPASSHCRTSGSVKFLGQDVTGWPAARIRALGIGVVPEDRLEQGLVPCWSIEDNFLLGRQRQAEFNRLGLLRRAAVRTSTLREMERYDVRPLNPDLPAEKLSGGNQQKLVLARELEQQPSVLLIAQPTRGVDVGAIEFIHRRLLRARDAGTGILLVSSDLDEILVLSDRVLVMYEGRILAEYGRGQVSERELGLKMGGA